MAQENPQKIISIDTQWEGPIANGKYSNFECRVTIEGNNGPMQVIAQVGSDKMTEKFTAGETYNGRFVGKKDEPEGAMWVCAFMAKSNPSLAQPKQEGYGGSGGGNGGGSTSKPNNSIVGMEVGAALHDAAVLVGRDAKGMNTEELSEELARVARIVLSVADILKAERLEGKKELQEPNGQAIDNRAQSINRILKANQPLRDALVCVAKENQNGLCLEAWRKAAGNEEKFALILDTMISMSEGKETPPDTFGAPAEDSDDNLPF